MSARESFLNAVRERRAQGEFAFLQHEERDSDLLLAPFRFRYLKEPMTWVPLSLMAVNSLILILHPERYPLSDATRWVRTGHIPSVAYLGPVAEETVMRGWLLPVSMHYLGREWASNLLTSMIFGAYHIPAYRTPWAHLLIGLYLGYQTQQREWTIGESIFLHSWWNLIVTLPAILRKEQGVAVAFPTLTLRF